ncbi:membrane protein [Saccharopolyspora rectivirgula]|uniref:Membrane protein n=2 Tax=Saccharopolyspora rectivirgula TaxID=28042 RepID=A0A073B1K5_9PSEU|nr:membrane protein [Saccharopolyspora rectivirgula]
MTALAVALAALGALGYALGARLQHAAVQHTMDDNGLGLRNQAQLVRNGRWLFGLIALGAGTLLHVCALGLAPLSVVQPVGAIALPITVLLSLRDRGVTLAGLGRNVLLAVVAATGGVAAFVLLAARSAQATPVGAEEQLVATQIVAVAVLVLGGLAALSRSNLRCVLFAAACAVCYGYVSLLMRAVTLQVGTVPLLEINPLPLLGVVVAVVVGAWLLQHGYASGPPDLVVACMTVIDPLVAVGLGIGLLGEADNVTAATAAGEALCALVACAGVFALARYRTSTEQQLTAVASGLAGKSSTDSSDRSCT